MAEDSLVWIPRYVDSPGICKPSARMRLHWKCSLSGHCLLIEGYQDLHQDPLGTHSIGTLLQRHLRVQQDSDANRLSLHSIRYSYLVLSSMFLVNAKDGKES